jgi:hypothetical protein
MSIDSSARARLFALVVVVAAAGCAKKDHGAAASPTAMSMSQGGAAGEQGKSKASSNPRTARLEVRAEFEVDVGDGNRAETLATTLSDLAVAHGGWVEQASLGQGGGHVVLRIPPTEIGAVRAALAGQGAIGREARTTKDVTDALADLDARLRTAREEERRLLTILAEKTGTLADVLAVERALSEVRERIERHEAEQRAAEGRVELATVEVFVHARAIAADAPLGRRITLAAEEGLGTARDALVATVLGLLRVGPTFLVFGAFVAAIVVAVRRARASKPVA